MTYSTTDQAIAIGRGVIEAEARALSVLAADLGPEFQAACSRILATTGRVIVSGMGKSGHIARKIASTLASTGTPAHFVHPAEASHGDLGMLTQGDIALLVSNSGETAELADIIAHCERFAIPMLGICANGTSTMAKACDIALILPAMPEAGAEGIVPTSSTTMALALGDALALTVMQARDFTPDHFRLFHPGGPLGAKLLRVRDLMHSDMPLVDQSCPMADTLLIISQKGFGVVGVTNDHGDLLGIITDGDLRRHMAGLMDKTAQEVMTERPRSLAPDAMAQSALALMTKAQITCLFVIAPQAPHRALGIVHIHDFLRAGII
jgi:arabinose-5-phosphate isomerase